MFDFAIVAAFAVALLLVPELFALAASVVIVACRLVAAGLCGCASRSGRAPR